MHHPATEAMFQALRAVTPPWRGAAYFSNDGLAIGLLILTAWSLGAALVFSVAARLQLRGQPALDAGTLSTAESP